MIVGQGPIALVVGAGGGCLDIFSLLYLGFYDIKFKLTQYKSKLGLIPQYTFDLREFDITNLKLGSKRSLIPQYT